MSPPDQVLGSVLGPPVQARGTHLTDRWRMWGVHGHGSVEEIGGVGLAGRVTIVLPAHPRHDTASGQPPGERSGPLEVTLVGVLAIQATGEPQGAPRIKSTAGELPDDLKALAGQEFL